MRRPGSASDSLWYKDAIIYELPVRAFFDSNADGVGDLAGLMQKLDYLQDLGVTCLWLLPFFPSPLRDDGYDISDYLSIHPNYGSMEDFQAFLAAAHDRGLQVMIELVLNHTSDQHAWFQAARRAQPGSVERDYYVWSDTDQKYRDARIIFTDTEKSNWTWDPVAHAYYWHRFFAHQPDLNYDNPRVVDEMLKVIQFWLDLGVDALRVDAIPYIIERDGTNCENLPETHELIKFIRREIDAGYSSRMILAEANQWPSDVRPYFGDGDECHMAFHFPLMPRIYMALRQEDRLPITDIMAQTPEIPATCQWGLFLRNHDELTLEMVTSDERDYMYLAYSADPRMRVNLGIRRRLAPLMDNNVRRIELLNSLLLSFPGTPIIYYGDEIGMGDNIYLGDRNGVRTPMQWSGDRNAGFSRATPLKLYSPVIMDPVFGYDAVNVEAQQSDPSSHLNWMRNMIALRKLFRVFGRGTLEFLNPENRKVLAYLRRYGSQRVLCVANLSRFPQPVDLDLSKLEGMTPVEMLGYVEFPRVSRQPYRLTLGAYGFLWLELHGAPEEARMLTGEPSQAVLTVSSGWESLFEGAARHRLETVALPGFLVKQRWFGAKSRKIEAVHVLDWVCLERLRSALAVVEVTYENGPPETYCLPLAMALDKTAGQLREAEPDALLAEIVTLEGTGALYDGVLDDSCRASLLTLIESSRELPARNGVIRGQRGAVFADLRGDVNAPLPSRRSTAEQSNSSIIYGERLILKVFRAYQAGPNPDCEIGKYLTDQAHFDGTPAFAGSIEYTAENGEPATLGMLQGLLANAADGWTSTLEELERYFECCANVPFPEFAGNEPQGLIARSERPPKREALDHIGSYLKPAATLGRRTAELHLALAASSNDPAFSPEPITAEDIQSLSDQWHERALQVFHALKGTVSRLPDDLVEVAGLVLGRRSVLLNRLRIPPDGEGNGLRIRIHGDYHLGQVLRVKTDYFILDFEGEPARPLEERRAKHSALKDVAGMLRSFNYAAQTALKNYVERRGESPARLESWARLWEQSVATEFLRAYRERAPDAPFLPSCPERFRALLDGYWLDKALYEVLYELNNRPSWTRIPLLAILSVPL